MAFMAFGVEGGCETSVGSVRADARETDWFVRALKKKSVRKQSILSTAKKLGLEYVMIHID